MRSKKAGAKKRKQGPMLQKIELQDPSRARGLEPLGTNVSMQHPRKQRKQDCWPLSRFPIG
jgi:hypothetical protein